MQEGLAGYKKAYKRRAEGNSKSYWHGNIDNWFAGLYNKYCLAVIPEIKKMEHKLFAVRTTANREEQVVDFIESNVKKKNLEVYTIVNAHGMRGYIFLEAKDAENASQAAMGIPYSRGILPKEVAYSEIEPMLEQIKTSVNIQEKDIVEIIHGPFKKEKAKVKRIDEQKEEVVVELLEAAIPIPITVKMDWVKVIRRESEEGNVEVKEE